MTASALLHLSLPRLASVREELEQAKGGSLNDALERRIGWVADWVREARSTSETERVTLAFSAGGQDDLIYSEELGLWRLFLGRVLAESKQSEGRLSGVPVLVPWAQRTSLATAGHEGPRWIDANSVGGCATTFMMFLAGDDDIPSDVDAAFSEIAASDESFSLAFCERLPRVLICGTASGVYDKSNRSKPVAIALASGQDTKAVILPARGDSLVWTSIAGDIETSAVLIRVDAPTAAGPARRETRAWLSSIATGRKFGQEHPIAFRMDASEHPNWIAPGRSGGDRFVSLRLPMPKSIWDHRADFATAIQHHFDRDEPQGTVLVARHGAGSYWSELLSTWPSTPDEHAFVSLENDDRLNEAGTPTLLVRTVAAQELFGAARETATPGDLNGFQTNSRGFVAMIARLASLCGPMKYARTSLGSKPANFRTALIVTDFGEYEQIQADSEGNEVDISPAGEPTPWSPGKWPLWKFLHHYNGTKGGGQPMIPGADAPDCIVLLYSNAEFRNAREQEEPGVHRDDRAWRSSLFASSPIELKKLPGDTGDLIARWYSTIVPAGSKDATFLPAELVRPQLAHEFFDACSNAFERSLPQDDQAPGELGAICDNVQRAVIDLRQHTQQELHELKELLVRHLQSKAFIDGEDAEDFVYELLAEVSAIIHRQWAEASQVWRHVTVTTNALQERTDRLLREYKLDTISSDGGTLLDHALDFLRRLGYLKKSPNGADADLVLKPLCLSCIADNRPTQPLQGNTR